MTRLMMVGAVVASMFAGGVALADQPGEGFGPGAEFRRPYPQHASWAVLGELQAGRWRGNDTLDIGRTAGRVTRLQLAAVDGAVAVRGLKVTFWNGESSFIPVNAMLSAGERSQTLDLPGEGRGLATVELYAHGRRGHGNRGGFYGGGRARLQLWGEVRAHRFDRFPPDRDRGWQTLGQTTLDGYRDRDTLGVAPEMGRFRQLMLVVREGAARLHAVSVTFANGETVSLPVTEAAGGTQVIDLPGDARMLRAVTVIGGGMGGYGGGRARVEILAS